MKALITGASSGIGHDLAIVLALAKKYDELIIVARSLERLQKLEEELSQLGQKSIIEIADLTNREACIKLFNNYPDVDLLINNAGLGDMGYFDETSLDKDLLQIDTNICALHILTKLYLGVMTKRDSGHILNVASIAGFMPGPLMTTYYATKNYVVRLSEGIRKELKARRSKVKISILCPGPVSTNFEKTANITFDFKGIPSMKVARYTIKHLNRFYIVPGFGIKMGRFMIKIMPTRIVANFIYHYKNKAKK